MNMLQARRAYQITRQALDPREQEADVFRRVTGALRAVLSDEGIRRARAIADYIAGMTDRFAIRAHHELTGRRIPEFDAG